MDRLLMHRRWINAFWWLLPFAALILFAVIQVIRGVYFYIFMHDMFVPLEGTLHLQHGQWPHRDFGSPVGVLYYIVHYLPTLVSPLSASTLIYANLLVALLVAAGTMAFARRRLPLWLASLTALYLGLTAASPRQIGEPLAVITNNASYNRFNWALIGLLALIAACPRPDPTRRSSVIDGAAVGALLLALFFIKLTYAVAGIGIIVIAMITVRRLADWRFPVALFGPFAAVVLLVEVLTGLVHLYLADIGTAAAVATDVLRPAFAVRLLFYCATGAVAALVVGLVWEWDRRRFLVWVPRTLLALAIILAGVAIGIQNHPELENPLLPIGVLVAGYPALRFLGRRSDDGGSAAPAIDATAAHPGASSGLRLAGIACAAGFLGMAAGPTFQDVASIGWTAAAHRAHGPEVAWLAATPLADLALYDSGAPESLKNMPGTQARDDVHLMEIIGDAASLVRRHAGNRRDVRVLPLTFSNPYPLLLGLPPIRHELAWWHFERTFSQQVKPDPALLLGGVDYLLYPKRYTSFSTSRAFRAAYAPEIEREFRQVDETRYWVMYARRDCRARSLC